MSRGDDGSSALVPEWNACYLSSLIVLRIDLFELPPTQGWVNLLPPTCSADPGTCTAVPGNCSAVSGICTANRRNLPRESFPRELQSISCELQSISCELHCSSWDPLGRSLNLVGCSVASTLQFAGQEGTLLPPIQSVCSRARGILLENSAVEDAE